MKLAACILAAGAGRRMGGPKALLDAGGGRTFLDALLAAFRDAGIAQRYVVMRPGAPPVAANGAHLLLNPEPERGMLSSLQLCMRALPAATDGLFVAPVDCPHVRPETIATLAAAFARARAPLVVPRFAGRRGHPSLFASALFDELLRAPADVGARAVVRAHAADRLEVDVPDPAVLDDIDTPAER